jgi:hypothetical protein
MPLFVPAPPPRSTPQSFYLDYVPQAWRAFWADAVPPEALAFAFDLVTGGVTLSIDLCGADVVARIGPAASPLLRISCDSEAWRAVALDLWPRMLRQLAPRLDKLRADLLTFAARRNLDALRTDLAKLSGTLRVDYVDDAGDTASFALQLGSGQGPHAQVIAQESDIWPLLRGEARLAQLFKSRFKMSGDPGYVLRLLAAFTLSV